MQIRKPPRPARIASSARNIAHTLETGAELITFDRHFESVRGLPVRVLRKA